MMYLLKIDFFFFVHILIIIIIMIGSSIPTTIDRRINRLGYCIVLFWEEE